MGDYNELVSICKHLLFDRFAPAPAYIRGLLGDGQGNVLVPDRPDYNYARFNRSSTDVFEIFNKEVSQPIDNLPILIGEYPWQPGLTQVVGIDWATYNQIGWGNTYANLQAHASTHEWPDLAPGSDYTRTFLRSIVPLQGYGAGSGTSYNFYAQPYEYDYTGTSQYWPGLPPISLAGALPATGTMRYMGVYLNPATNQLGAVSGSAVAYVDNSEPPRPKFPLNVYPVAYARLYGGQQFIAERDTRDARRLWNNTLIFTGTSSGGGGWGFTHILRVSPTNPSADYSTISAAVAAASAGDVILLDAATYNETVTINKAGITLIGMGVGSTIITNVGAATITVTAANVTLRFLTVNNTSAGATGDCVLLSTGASDVVIDECTIEKISGAATLASAVHVASGTNHVILNSKLRCTTGTSRYGLLADTGSNSTTMINGRCQGSTKDVRTNDAGAAIVLQDVILASATATSPSYEEAAGAIGGTYFLTNGNLVFIDNSGIVGRVWLEDTSTRIRKFFPDLPTAIAASGAGDAIYLEAGTYTLSAGETLSTNNLTIYAAAPGNVTITLATDDSITLNVTGDNVTLRNLTINHTGAGSVGYPVAFDGDGFTLEGCTLNKTGAPSLGAGLYQFGGTGAKSLNSFITASGATTNYGYYNTIATGAIEFWGGKLSGTQFDIWSDISGSTLKLYDTVLGNATHSYAGTLSGEGFYNGHRLRVKPAGINAGRLTLSTGVPVLLGDVTAATTGYFTPFDGAETEIFNGYFWIEYPFAELSLAIPSTVYRLFDRFVYDNAGVLTLEDTSWNQLTLTVTAASNATPIVVTYTGTDPTNNDIVAISGVAGNTAANGIWSIANVNAGANTFELEGSTGNGAYTSGGTVYRLNETRATALVRQDGKLVKSGATTRLYLGTGMTTGTSGQTEFVLTQPGNGLLWNYYNRRHFALLQSDTTSHTYTSATARIYRNVNTNKIGFVLGVLEDGVMSSLKTEFNFDAGDGQVAAGLSLNRTGSLNAHNTRITDVGQFRYAMDFFPVSQAIFVGLAAGYNFFQLTQTGAATSPDFLRSGGAMDFIG